MTFQDIKNLLISYGLTPWHEGTQRGISSSEFGSLLTEAKKLGGEQMESFLYYNTEMAGTDIYLDGGSWNDMENYWNEFVDQNKP